MNDPKYIVIHHSLTEDGEAVDWDAIRRYHKNHYGWRDIGYHYGIERLKSGLAVQVGRSESKEGAHCANARMNFRSIGICVVGNYDEKAPPKSYLELLAHLCERIMRDYDIPTVNVIGHRDAGLMDGFDWRIKGDNGVRQFKTCPGIMFDVVAFHKYLEGVGV